MNCHPISAFIPERYDFALSHSRNDRLPVGAHCPLPTRFWPAENVRLLERYVTWLLDGGACEYSTNIIYLPIAGHALGLNLKPHQEIDLEADLDLALEYVRGKGAGENWLRANRYGLEKFRKYLRLERGLGEAPKHRSFNPLLRADDLPAWLIGELERFQEVQSRNWRPARVDRTTCSFWSIHLGIWGFLCRQKHINEIGDLKRQDILDYVSARLNQKRSVATVNTELRSLTSFLKFLQEEGYRIPQTLLQIQGLKQPDSLPKHVTAEQLRLLCHYLDTRIASSRLASHRRDALLDRSIFYLLWQCGLRTGEVEELKLEDLDLGSKRMDIRDSKGRKDRTVYLPGSACSHLQSYLENRGKGPGTHVFLFRNAPLRRGFVFERIKALGERVGVKLYPHRLRHTCATQLLNAGCRVTSIQRFLGHKKLNTTMIYARVNDRVVAEDYFKAMESVEKDLSEPMGLFEAQPLRKMTRLVEALWETALDPTQAEMVRELQMSFSELVNTM